MCERAFQYGMCDCRCRQKVCHVCRINCCSHVLITTINGEVLVFELKILLRCTYMENLFHSVVLNASIMINVLLSILVTVSCSIM